MNLILALIAISALTVALASHTRTRRLVRDINAITQPHVPARHAVIRNAAGPRQHPTGTMPQRDRIPIQVPPEVEAAHARAIEGYDNGANDDLLIRPFVATSGTDNTAAVSAVP